MNRRTLLTLAAASGLALALPAQAQEPMLTYEPGLIDQLLAQGDTVFVDYYADWCPTCRAQDRAIAELRAENPAFDTHLTFVRVDWDTWQGSEIVSRYNIPRRSTLIVLQGEAELGRIVANTRKDAIAELLNTALAAAM